MPVHEPTPDLAAQEFQQLLHEELQGLPEKYRVPLVLRYLEGKSNDGAVLALGWPRLRSSRRLCMPSTCSANGCSFAGWPCRRPGSASSWPESAAAAAMPPALFTATLQAAILFVADFIAAGTIAVPVAALTNELPDHARHQTEDLRRPGSRC